MVSSFFKRLIFTVLFTGVALPVISQNEVGTKKVDAAAPEKPTKQPKTEAEIVTDLNKRIDRLEIMSEEIAIRAQTMNELEMVVRAMELSYLRRLNRIHDRKTAGKDHYEILEMALDIPDDDAEIADLKKQLKKIDADNKFNKKSLQEQLFDALETKVPAPRTSDEKSKTIQMLLQRARTLRGENLELKARAAAASEAKAAAKAASANSVAASKRN